MKKHFRFILTVCLTLCIILCLGLVACQPDKDGKNTFTFIVLNEDGTPAAHTWIQACSSDGGTCDSQWTDENGKYEYDLSKSPWTESESLHAQIKVPEGYSAYNEKGDLYNYDPEWEVFDAYVNHHEVKSITFIIKKDTQVTPPITTDITEGYEYEDNFLGGETKYYSANVRISDAVLVADTNGAEFDLSVSLNSAAIKTETLSSSKTSVDLSFGSSDTYGHTVLIMLTPKTTAAAKITFTLCPVYELGSILNIRKTDVFKAYFNLPNTPTELSFTNPNPDAQNPFGGFPVTVKIGSQTVTWGTADAISTISTTATGKTLVTFEFEDADSANLYLQVDDANATLNNSVTADVPVEINLSNDEPKEFTFIPTEAGTYVIKIEGASNNAIVSYTGNDTYWSDTYYSSENGGTLIIEIIVKDIVFDENNELVSATERANINSNDKIVIICSTENSNGDTYTLTVTAKTSSMTPSTPGKTEE